MAAHVPSVPSNVNVTGGASKAFVSALSILDRTYSDKLVEKYGNELYSFFIDMLGSKLKTDNGDFYHYEKRRRHSAIQVASIAPASPTAGVSVTVTIAAGSHYDSGTKSPARVGEVVMVSGSGVLGKISAVSTATPSAHTATIQPLKSTDTFAPAANDWLLFQGIQHLGEASDKTDSLQPIMDKVTNFVTEIREDYQITDKASMEKIEFQDPTSGQYSFRYLGTNEAEKRFLNNQEFLTMFSDQVTNTAITANGTKGTKGVLAQIAAGGSDLSYTAGSMTISNFQAVTRELTFNGAGAELHHLMDIYQFQEIQRLLFSTYTQGAVLWGSVGGSQDIAAKYGFASLAIDGFNFHFKKYAPFSPEWTWGVAPSATPNYRNYSIVIPQGFANQPDGSKLPAICMRYQEIPGVGEINAYETGGLAMSNKTPKQELWNHFVAHRGIQVAAANQCVIFQA